ncbi:uncharacterized protein APUU_40007A [Aspergillus puulaauensis]|uniref:Acyclic terpene utilisation N-terminal domain-containing protein n=1 Tax=Aspergillus puulaauensis TaxID=1220207 RepID=A0A7R7XMA2_9EURO|nr:uncharacterized protein APUU_40007A [Aspergillus puulaauensis]BCS23563.1 hypothetical protein APUU_40007A [Aspergillus puulaauensis]
MTIQWHGAEKAGRAQFKRPGVASPIATFDPSFMGTFTPALPYLQQRRIKVAVNAGSSEPDKLTGIVIAAIKEQNLNRKVAWIQGGL